VIGVVVGDQQRLAQPAPRPSNSRRPDDTLSRRIATKPMWSHEPVAVSPGAFATAHPAPRPRRTDRSKR
jgi:hypothetical protein